ncbi:mitochondrial import inner membrane translocase subunit TIM14-like [Corticium candelabrum]|uniref:mitochondrial import inner membrane translocase subunit TIM14-like n=1 Tax=Corticium candelabrum TaxID=121492 RepID=UPI002E26A2FB|nr:mitochondrial import inner membrane translocase subunit TIM14-like [Corticium candelabrum]
MASAIVAGLSIAAAAFGARLALQAYRRVQGSSLKFSKPLLTSFYRGGFAPKMTKREAGQILGISPSSPSNKVREAHKRIMLLNHPDRGGSPYMASKINEAKDYLESKR